MSYPSAVSHMRRKGCSDHSGDAMQMKSFQGILIAPTFTAAGSLSGRMRIRLMELSGFKVFHKWTQEEYLDFLKANGFETACRKTFDGGLKLTYAEARVKPY